MADAPSHFRHQKRQPVSIQVRYRRDADGAALEQVGTTNDLGIGGAFVEAARAPGVGEKVVLIVKSPTTWDPLELHGEVRWISDGDAGPAGFGVHFGELAGDQAKALWELIHAAAYTPGDGAGGDAR
jgi:hypothetical protein